METEIVTEGDPSCSHKMEPDHVYDLPDPDPRNPVKVKTCKYCEREIHIATPLGAEPLPTEYYE